MPPSIEADSRKDGPSVSSWVNEWFGCNAEERRQLRVRNKPQIKTLGLFYDQRSG